MNNRMPPKRCHWCTSDPLYQRYHDEEWGRPVTDRRTVFEFLCLESQQAGLSWITVLRKREHYRKCFHDFDPDLISTMTDAELDTLVLDAGLIRHRAKLDAIVTNAKAWLKWEKNGDVPERVLWDMVKRSVPRTHAEAVEVSTAMAKQLKKRNFKFLGPTSVLAFMQATGMVNHHEAGCFLSDS